MSRSEGSLCSHEAKCFADEITTISGLPYKQNLDYLRLIEKLIIYRVVESVRETCTSNEITSNTNLPPVQIELPLIGILTVKPVIFHEQHRLTNKPSLHFEYVFEPLSGFKRHLMDAYLTRECEIPMEFSNMYGQKLVDLYKEETE